MPPQSARQDGYQDGLRKAPMAPSRCGYPIEYEAAYRQGLLCRSLIRRALDSVGQFFKDLAGWVP